MMIAAVIQDGIVITHIMADANVDIPPPGTILVNIDDVRAAPIGSKYDGVSFEHPEAPSEEVYVPESITRRQCALQLLFMGLITSAEALAMTKTGEPPDTVKKYISSLPQEIQYLIEIDCAADTYMRSNPLLDVLMKANGGTDAEIDQFFIAAAAR